MSWRQKDHMGRPETVNGGRISSSMYSTSPPLRARGRSVKSRMQFARLLANRGVTLPHCSLLAFS